MRKRFWIIIIPALAILLLSLAIIVVFPAYRNLGFGVMLFDISVIQFFSGIKSFQTTTIQKKVMLLREQPLLPWWKNHFIILALFNGCSGVFLCLIGLSLVIERVASLYVSHLDGVVGFFSLFALLVFGLAIYGTSLALQYAQAQRIIARTLMECHEKTEK